VVVIVINPCILTALCRLCCSSLYLAISLIKSFHVRTSCMPYKDLISYINISLVVVFKWEHVDFDQSLTTLGKGSIVKQVT
jgi:hypothetical protein